MAEIQPQNNNISNINTTALVDSTSPVKASDQSAAPATTPAPTAAEGKETKVVAENLTFGTSINLMPQLTKAEVKIEEKKSSFNIWSAVMILALVIISIVIICIDSLTKLSLQREKNNLSNIEKNVNTKSDTISTNNQILERFRLYQDIKKNTYSPKGVLLYWQNFIGQMCTIQNIEIDNNLNFIFRGYTTDLTSVAKIWHYLSIDPRVKQVNLNSVSKNEDSASFEFEGSLDITKFSSDSTANATTTTTK